MPASTERPKLEWLRVNGADDLRHIGGFIRRVKRGAAINIYSITTDRNGNVIIMLGYDRKPDSDWGDFQGNSAAIWCRTDDLMEPAEKEVRKALGMESAQ